MRTRVEGEEVPKWEKREQGKGIKMIMAYSRKSNTGDSIKFTLGKSVK